MGFGESRVSSGELGRDLETGRRVRMCEFIFEHVYKLDVGLEKAGSHQGQPHGAWQRPRHRRAGEAFFILKRL